MERASLRLELRSPTNGRDEPRKPEEQVARLQFELCVTGQEGRTHELFVSAGQSTSLVHEVLSVQEIMQCLMGEAEEALNLRVG
jgi:hypothetical protein